jgi:hypothetical protein
MVVAVVEKGGTKVVTLSAPVMIENRLDQPIEMCYQVNLLSSLFLFLLTKALSWGVTKGI